MEGISSSGEVNVLIPASVAQRCLAFVLDLLFVGWPLFPLLIISGAAPPNPRWESTVAILSLSLIFLNTVLSLANGQSFGKRVVGLAVVGADGAPAAPGVRMLRSFWSALSFGLSALGVSTLDGAMAAWRRDGRALHDLLAGTQVMAQRGAGVPEVALNSSGDLAVLPQGWQPVTSPPSLFTLNLIGTTLSHGQSVEPSGQILYGTHCFVVAVMPVCFLRRYLYRRKGDEFRFLASAPITPGMQRWNLIAPFGLLLTLAFTALFSARPEPSAHAQPAAVRTPQSAAEQLEMAKGFLAAGQFEPAAAKAEAALKGFESSGSTPGQRNAARFVLARALRAQGKRKEALQEFRTLLQADPKNRAYAQAAKELAKSSR